MKQVVTFLRVGNQMASSKFKRPTKRIKKPKVTILKRIRYCHIIPNSVPTDRIDAPRPNQAQSFVCIINIPLLIRYHTHRRSHLSIFISSVGIALPNETTGRLHL